MSPLKPMSVLAAALCLAAVAILAPLWLPLVLAAWFADLLRPVIRKLERLLGGRRRAAGVLIVLITLGILAPLVGIVAALTNSIWNFLGQVRAALEGQGSLAAVLLGGGNAGGVAPVKPDSLAS
jgi:predicted PurR-regulated permease PerM